MYLLTLYNVGTKRGDCMKDKVLQIRVDDEFIAMLEYLLTINGYKTIAETVRKIIEKEYRKETTK